MSKPKSGKGAYSVWLLAVLLSIWFTPTLRLPGNIPIRLDDILIFGAGAVMFARMLFRLRLRRPDNICMVLFALAGSMLLSAVVAGQRGDLPVGVKEYLDLIRPIEFLITYLAVRGCDPKQTFESIRTGFRIGIVGLAFCALVQFLFMSPGSSGLLATIFLQFTTLSPEHARSFFGLRPFATFQTPTDLGYVMTIFLLAELTLYRGRKWRYIVLALIGLVLSNTRTFIFAAPLLLLIYAVINGQSNKARIKLIALGIGTVLAGGVLLFYVAPLVNADFSVNTVRTATDIANGDYGQDESIAIRLRKLDLIVYTWDHAPVLGVASREMLGAAADSEYVYTFNRYGLLGIGGLIALYVASLKMIKSFKKYRRHVYTFTFLMLVTTFIYGFTQGALINVRIGIIPLALIGFASSLALNANREIAA